jgi:hypothetical protein
VDRDVRVLDRARIEERNHQAQVVVRALEGERRALLPRRPHRAHRPDVVAHPRPGRPVRQAEPPRDVAPHLAAEPQDEAPARELLDVPRRHRGDGGAARERHRHRGGETETRGARRGQRHDHVRIHLGLLHCEAVVAERFHEPGVLDDAAEIERRLGGAKAGIELAERQERLDAHGASS